MFELAWDEALHRGHQQREYIKEEEVFPKTADDELLEEFDTFSKCPETEYHEQLHMITPDTPFREVP